ncbi:hypothetical protein TASIC1_0005051300 [Trichoderma asperellum]|uniref:Uncharacterized protein n=1 Tax=Trichoderma asperellum TaxID=101201 RepID=A0A6V8QTJ3_TRIAP|nr:hypothetical protein TASIC1_0005051300 [Trichoderma asperellum]
MGRGFRREGTSSGWSTVLAPVPSTLQRWRELLWARYWGHGHGELLVHALPSELLPVQVLVPLLRRMRPIALRLACERGTEYIEQQLYTGKAFRVLFAATGTENLRRLPVAPDQAPSAPEAPCRVQYSSPFCMMEPAIDGVRPGGLLRTFWLAVRAIQWPQMLLFSLRVSRSRARCSAPTGGTDPDKTARRGRRGSAQHGGA